MQAQQHAPFPLRLAAYMLTMLSASSALTHSVARPCTLLLAAGPVKNSSQALVSPSSEHSLQWTPSCALQTPSHGLHSASKSMLEVSFHACSAQQDITKHSTLCQVNRLVHHAMHVCSVPFLLLTWPHTTIDIRTHKICTNATQSHAGIQACLKH